MGQCIKKDKECAMEWKPSLGKWVEILFNNDSGKEAFCCPDHACQEVEDSDPQKWKCVHLKEVGVGETRPMNPRNRLEEAVRGACTDDDAALIKYAVEKGYNGDVAGCQDAIGYCSVADVVNFCPLTCATESGCSEYTCTDDADWTNNRGLTCEDVYDDFIATNKECTTNSLLTNCCAMCASLDALGEQESLAQGMVKSTGIMPDIAVFFLAVLGTASLIATTLARCTKKDDYTEVSESSDL